MSIRILTGIILLPVISLTAKAQTLGLYGGAGISYDGFFPDRNVTTATSKQRFLPEPTAVLGIRYHTLQDFDITLDASLGIARIRLPTTGEDDINLQYEQIQSLLLLGSGLNIPFDNGANLMPFMLLGAGFFDFWDLVEKKNTSYFSSNNDRDFKTNHWTVVCGAGIDYQFKLLLSSGINLRGIYTPLNIFKEPIPYTLNNQTGPTHQRLQGKLLQFQLTYRVNLPIARWKDGYDY